MKKILLGFIAIGLLTFVGCEKDDDTDTETIDSTETSNDDGTTDDSNTNQDSTGTTVGDETTDSASTTASIEYGEGATDIDGNTYQSVIIGEQEWMAENLKTTKYSDGTLIPNVTDNEQWENLSTDAWCNYNNDAQNESIHGKLYNGYSINDSTKLCPNGWHVPSIEEWKVLIDYLAENGHKSKEGLSLKSKSGWGEDWNGTDDYGWNGLPGGFRSYAAFFLNIDDNGFWWSSTQDDNYVFSAELDWDIDTVFIYDYHKTYALSVRCLKD